MLRAAFASAPSQWSHVSQQDSARVGLFAEDGRGSGRPGDGPGELTLWGACLRPVAEAY